jgi:Holliday junction DNA helicase RuvA
LGLRVFVPAALRDRVSPGEEVFLQTYLVVREESLTLYGFETRDAHDFFSLLLGVDGVGPRTALSIISVLSTDAIRRAVLSEQADVFSRVPGVGKKTAQKILLHLQGRIGPADDTLSVAAAMTDVEAEVVAALTGLGYSIVEAQTALQSVPRDAPMDVETRLRMALQYFSS